MRCSDVAALLDPGDVIIDGGNTRYHDDIRRAAELAERGIEYLDVGTSGGVRGLERGFCLMVGGPREVFERLEPLFASLAPGVSGRAAHGRAHRAAAPGEHGYLHCGPAGAGHFVKMVHNGIEYGLMAAYAEGLNVLHGRRRRPRRAATPTQRRPRSSPRSTIATRSTLPAVAEVWRRGSVVSSWLLDLTAAALAESPDPGGFSGRVSDSGEGRWTSIAAIEEGIPTPVLTAALYARFASRGRGRLREPRPLRDASPVRRARGEAELSRLVVEVHADAEAVARRGAEIVGHRARRAIEARGRFTLALSGGRTPWVMVAALAAEDIPWERVALYQADERVAPDGHPDRNLTQLLTVLAASAAASVELHAMPVTGDLEAGAAAYAATLPGRLDLVHLGLGADGHTASLVPDDPVLAVRDRDVACTEPYQGHRRMTLTYPAIDRAREALWLVTGHDKRGALERLLAGDDSIPAGRIGTAEQHVLADAAAAGESS